MLFPTLKFNSHGFSASRIVLRALAAVVMLTMLSACIKEGRDGAIDGPPPSREWVLVWSDEFEGTALDLDNWSFQIGDGKAYGLSGWGNNEQQYYTEGSVSVSDGNLVITSAREDITGVAVDPAFGDPNTTYQYSSGRIRTSGKFELTYGRVEARIKMPATKGIWNAFWLLGSEMSPYGVWPGKGEIDIVEAYKRGDSGVPGDDPFASGAAHFGADIFPDNWQFLTKKKNPFNHFDDFHVYAIEWDAEEIRWFIDGENFFSLRNDNYWNYYDDAEEGFKAGGDSAPFDEDQYIILNAAVGGNLPRDVGEEPDPDTFTSDEMLVDYVRVYECPFDASTGTGCKNKIDQADEFLKFEFGPNRAFAALFDYYIDGVGPETLPTGKTLAFNDANLGGLVYQEMTEPNGNTYIDIVAPAGGASQLGFKDSQDENLIIAGFPRGLGDIKFDLYIESDSTANVEGGGVFGRISIAIVSGNTSTAKAFPLSDFERDTWQRVTVPISELLDASNSGIRWDEISEVVRFGFFSLGGDGLPTHVRIDNVQFACGGKSACGIVDEVPVYTNMVEPFWDRGIVGNDQDQVTAANADYTDGTQYHVQWREYDTGLPGFDTVVETTFGTTGAVGAVNFVGASNAVATIGALTNGEFRFDMRMRQNPNNEELFFKIDGESSSTGEQPLGNLPIDTWVSFSCPIATLEQQGLDISTVTAPFVLVPGNNGAGQGVVVEWDNVTFSPVQSGSSTVMN
ncbi:MAG: family 16 glycosylhydrolase, partial [Pseudomonadales bacterium]|nr:family 16 glycosylhydrolase [Pseudomonadales bacterium]